MAIKKPARKTQNPLTTGGGGGVRGGSMGTGGAGRISVRPGNGTKPAPKPKVELKPEPSTVTIKPGKYNLNPDSAAKANAKIKAERARTSSTKNEKSALKAANKPAKYKSADAARAQSLKRAVKTVAERNASLKEGKPVKPLTTEQKFAYRKSLDYGPDGARLKAAKAPSKLSKAIAKKLYPKGVPSKKSK